jgi:hypothetical protein
LNIVIRTFIVFILLAWPFGHGLLRKKTDESSDFWQRTEPRKSNRAKQGERTREEKRKEFSTLLTLLASKWVNWWLAYHLKMSRKQWIGVDGRRIHRKLQTTPLKSNESWSLVAPRIVCLCCT